MEVQTPELDRQPDELKPHVEQDVLPDISDITLSALEIVVQRGDVEGAVSSIEEKYQNDINAIFDSEISNDEVFERITELEAKKFKAEEQIRQFGSFASDQMVEQNPSQAEFTVDLEAPLQPDVDNNVELPTENIDTDTERTDRKEFHLDIGDDTDLDPDEISYLEELLEHFDEISDELDSEDIHAIEFTDRLNEGSEASNSIVQEQAPDTTEDSQETEVDIEGAAPVLGYELLTSDPEIKSQVEAEPEVEPIDSFEVANTKTEEADEEPEIDPSSNEYAVSSVEAFIITDTLNEFSDDIRETGINLKKSKISSKLYKQEKIYKIDKKELADMKLDVMQKFFDTMGQEDEFINLQLVDESSPYNLMYDFVDYVGQVNDKRSWKVIRELVEARLQEQNQLEVGSVITPSVVGTKEEAKVEVTSPIREQTKNIIEILDKEVATVEGKVSFQTIQEITDREEIDIKETAKSLITNEVITLDTDKQEISFRDAVVLLSITKNNGSAKTTKEMQVRAQKIAEEEITQYHEQKQQFDSDDASSYQPQDDPATDDTQFALAA